MNENEEKKEYKYCYILCTEHQCNNINLLEYKAKIQGIFKEFFKEKYKSSIIKPDRYVLKLHSEFTIGEKMMLGREVSEKSGLSDFVYRFAYNNETDKSGQLFKRCKEGEK